MMLMRPFNDSLIMLHTLPCPPPLLEPSSFKPGVQIAGCRPVTLRNLFLRYTTRQQPHDGLKMLIEFAQARPSSRARCSPSFANGFVAFYLFLPFSIANRGNAQTELLI